MMAGEKRQMTSGSKAVKTAAVTSAAPQNFEKNPAQPHRQEIGPAAIYKAACIYLSLPLFIFLGGWLDGFVSAADSNGFLQNVHRHFLSDAS